LEYTSECGKKHARHGWSPKKSYSKGQKRKTRDFEHTAPGGMSLQLRKNENQEGLVPNQHIGLHPDIKPRAQTQHPWTGVFPQNPRQNTHSVRTKETRPHTPITTPHTSATTQPPPPHPPNPPRPPPNSKRHNPGPPVYQLSTPPATECSHTRGAGREIVGEPHIKVKLLEKDRAKTARAAGQQTVCKNETYFCFEGGASKKGRGEGE